MDFSLQSLEANPEGVTEHQLLEEIGHSDLGRELPGRADSYSLFQSHFLLFHALYRLRQKLWAEEKVCLEISALRIIVRESEANENVPEAADGLAEYYLDPENYYRASPESVDEMLLRFRILFENRQYRDEALSILGLVDPVDNKGIRQAWRQQLMQHHPDRGGCPEKAAELNRAFDRLLRQRGNSS